MTLNEAKNILINRGFVEINGDYVFDGDKWRDAIAVISKWLEQQPCEDWYDVPSDKMTLEQAKQAVKDLRKKLVEYLEQQPCDDCISRQAVKDIICSEVSIDTDADKEYVCELIDKLPSVTPKEKTAAWVPTDEEPHEIYECNACGWLLYDEDRTDFKYCPSCGARMIESQESEDKNEVTNKRRTESLS